MGRQDLAHQVFYATRELERAGVDPQTVDLEAEIDTSLTYAENRARIVLPLIRRGRSALEKAERWLYV